MSISKKLNACEEAQEWADSQESYRKAWDICNRGDWMLWVAARKEVDIRVLTKAMIECAKLVKHLMTDERSINALRVAENFADGKATLGQLRVTAHAAHAASCAAYTAAAAYDAYAAHAAYDAAHAAREDVLAKSADICRKYIKFEDLGIEK